MKARVPPPPTQEQQLAGRATRAAASFRKLEDGSAILLVGVPLCWSGENPLSEWAQLRYEAQASFRLALGPLGMSLALAPRPALSAQLQLVATPESIASWLSAITNSAVHELPLVSADTRAAGAYVWMGTVHAAPGQLAAIQRLFFRTGPDIGRVVGGVTVRLEALLEAAGAQARVFPLTAFWNSLSLSRITYAKVLLTGLTALKIKWRARRIGSQVVVSDKDGVLLCLDFPEETNADISPLFAGRGGFDTA